MKWMSPVAITTTVVPEFGDDKQILAGLKIMYHDRAQIERMLATMQAKVTEGAVPGLLEETPWLYMLRIRMPCGSSALFKTAADIPRGNLPCPCGDPRHFLVLYADIPARVASPTWP